MGEIVVGYDGSDCSKTALERALELARPLGDSIVLVFGYAPPGLWGGEISEHEDAIEEYGAKVMEEARQRVVEESIEAEVAMVPKRGWEALVEVGDERNARMIVVGSYGEPPLKGVILGSTPTKLLHTSERPVLVVPADREKAKSGS